VRREDIRELTRAVPFRPFRIFISTGETFDIRHPDMIWPTNGAVHIGIPAPGGPVDAPDAGRMVSLYHIQKIETLPAPPPAAGSNGSG
jgi:hypothetical protein